MVQKYKSSSFRTAFRLAPLAASLTAMVLVAACARTNPGKAKIGDSIPLTPEQKASALYANAGFSGYDFHDPKNMALAARLQGASLVGSMSASGMRLGLSVALKSGSDILAAGKISAAGTIPMIDANAKADPKEGIDATATCAEDACKSVAIQLTEWKMEDAPAAATAAPAGSPEKPAIAVETSPVVPKKINGGVVLIIFNDAAPVALAAPPTEEVANVNATPTPSPTPAVVNPSYTLALSTPTSADQANGTLLTYEDAIKAKTGVAPAPASAPAKTTLKTKVPAAKDDLQPVSITSEPLAPLSSPKDLSKIDLPKIQIDAPKAVAPKAPTSKSAASKPVAAAAVISKAATPKAEAAVASTPKAAPKTVVPAKTVAAATAAPQAAPAPQAKLVPLQVQLKPEVSQPKASTLPVTLKLVEAKAPAKTSPKQTAKKSAKTVTKKKTVADNK